MKLINTLTDSPNQNIRIVLDDGSILAMNISYWAQQQGWYYNFTHPLLTQGWRRMVSSPNMLRQFRGFINFGLYLNTSDGYEPVFLEDFASGRAQLYQLNAQDIVSCETLINQIA